MVHVFLVFKNNKLSSYNNKLNTKRLYRICNQVQYIQYLITEIEWLKTLKRKD